MEDFRAIVDLNLVAPLIVMQEAIPVLREQGESAIINVSSGVTLMAVPGSATYSSSKSGLNQLSAVARNELKDEGITPSPTIYPFVTDTELYEKMRAVPLTRRAQGGGPPPTPPSTSLRESSPSSGAVTPSSACCPPSGTTDHTEEPPGRRRLRDRWAASERSRIAGPSR